MRRPADLTRKIQVCLPPEIADRLAHLAAQVGSTQSQLARAILTSTLGDYDIAAQQDPTSKMLAAAGAN